METIFKRTSLHLAGDRQLWKFILPLVLLFALSAGKEVFSQTITSSAAGGNWNSTSTWVGGVVPGASNSVIIAGGGNDVVLNVTATIVNLTIDNGGLARARLIHNAGISLTVTGNVTIAQSSLTNVANAWRIDGGTATVSGLISFPGTSTDNTRTATIRISSGALNANGGMTFTTSVAASKVIFMSQSPGTGTLNLKGALTIPSASSTLTAGTAGSNFNYADANPQTINFFSSGAYNNLNVNNTSATGAALSAAITSSNVTGNISVGNITSGSVFSAGNFNIGLAASKTLTIAANSTMNAGSGVISFPATPGSATINGTFKTANTSGFSGGTSTAISSTNNPAITLAATSTIEYNASGAQTVTDRSYTGNVTLTGATKTIGTAAAQTVSILKNLTINSGATWLGATFNPILNVGGNFSNSGSFIQGTGLITFNGSVAQSISGSSATTFSNNVTLNNTTGMTIAKSPTFGGILTFANGKITTGANKAIFATTATTAGAGAGKYIYGNLEIFILNGSAPSVNFIIGDAANYTPALITFSGVTTGSGSLVAYTTAGDHPDIANSGINPVLSVNRNWTIAQGAVPVGGFSSYGGAFTFINGTPVDLDAGANTANFIISKLSGGLWGSTTTGARTTTSTAASGMTTFGAYQIGEPGSLITVATHPSNTQACIGAGASFTSTSASVPTPTVLWQRDPNTGVFANITAVMDGGVYTNFTTNTLNISNSTGLNNYKYRAVFTNVNGTATSNSATLTVVNLPSAAGAITGSGVVCQGQTGVAYSVTPISGATGYIWTYTGVGFTPSGNTASITASFSASATAGNLTVRGSNSCGSGTVSASFPITLTAGVGAAGAITGTSSICTSGAGVYSVPVIPGATFYTWIYSGAGFTPSGNTASISGSFSSSATSGNLTVKGANGCVTGVVSPNFPIAVSYCPPHSMCNGCHINHTAPGAQLTLVGGNANLCMSCHNAAGVASASPFADIMRAVPGVGGISHSWNALAVNTQYQTTLPSNPGMLQRVYSGQIVCSTCHDQHANTLTPFLRMSNTEDALCLNCHSARDVRRYADNPANRGTHPVGIDYDPTVDPRFQSTTFPLSATDKVVCTTCHDTHNSISTDGNILRAATIDATCTDCHIDVAARRITTHEGMSCSTCHYAHETGSNNILLVRNNIVTPTLGTKAVVFTANSAAANYGDGIAPFNGVCEVCHTTAVDHYQAASGGTSDARHLPSPQKCINCHPHDQGFSAQTDCFACHNVVTDKPGIGPTGGRRQIVDNLGNGAGTGGDFKRTSHHALGAIPTVDDCLLCHYMGDHKKGTVKLLDPDQGYLSVITYNPANKASVEDFCLNCHDANGVAGDMTPFSDNVTVPVVDKTMWLASSHKTKPYTCMDCHDNGHGSNKNALLGPFNYAGTGTGTDLMNEEEGFCLSCHGAGGVATVKVHLAFSSYTNTATSFFKHDPTATYRKHTNGETGGAAFGGANRHVECADCHNPHGAKSGTALAPTLLPTLIGARGVEPIYAGVGAPTGFTWQNAVTQEYQVCYKCHSSYTTLPTYLPDGVSNATTPTYIADGLKKLTTGGVNTQIADYRDMAREFNPNGLSFHPVMAAGKNLNILAATFQTGYTFGSRIYCNDCHNNSNSATAGHGNGPHGSANLHLLDRGTGGTAQFKTSHGSPAPSALDVCTKCHKSGSYYTGNTSSRFGEHQLHVNNEQGECYLCHDNHGSEQYHLMNFNRNNGGGNTCISAITTNSQAAFGHAAGTTKNWCGITCHGEGHSATSKTYTPAYN
ncbi:MAG: cytochrome c3 family protein [Bacteroidota bacterium]